MNKKLIFGVFGSALAIAVGFIIYKFVARMLGEENIVEGMAGATGSMGPMKMDPQNYCQVDSTNSPSGLQHYPMYAPNGQITSACKRIADCKAKGGHPEHTSMGGGGGVIRCNNSNLAPITVGGNGMEMYRQEKGVFPTMNQPRRKMAELSSQVSSKM
jgi:hypothetical protein